MLKFKWKDQIINNIDNNIDGINAETMHDYECNLLSKHKSQNHIMAYIQVSAGYGICSVAVYQETTYVAAAIKNIAAGSVLEYRFYKNRIIIEHDFAADSVMKRLMKSITADVYRYK